MSLDYRPSDRRRENVTLDKYRVNDYCLDVKKIRRVNPNRAPEQLVFLAIQRAADRLLRDIEAVLSPTGLSPTQYNVLRILRSAGKPLPCGAIAAQMITRDPDMTRLLDRLERRGLIERARSTEDRRVVQSRITEAGLTLLGGLDETMLLAHRSQLGHLDEHQLASLLNLLKNVLDRTNNKEPK